MKCKPIPEFTNEYVISKDGDIFRRLSDGFSRIKPATNEDGYLTVVLYKDNEPSFKYVHNLVASSWLGKGDDDETIVNHKDGDKTNNNADNLQFVDPQENTEHAYDKGLAKGPKGEKNGKSKLTQKQVDKIRKSKEPGNKLAALYKVDPAAISMIRTGKRW